MISTSELCQRFGISKPQFQVRKRSLLELGLDIPRLLENRESVYSEKVEAVFYAQHEHLIAGGELKTFQLPIVPEIVDSLPVHNIAGNRGAGVIAIAPESIEAIARNVAQVLTPLLPPPDPTWKLQGLRTAARFGYQMSSSQVRNLIDVTPTVKWGQTSFTRGSFIFTKVGKIGRQNAWIVKSIEY